MDKCPARNHQIPFPPILPTTDSSLKNRCMARELSASIHHVKPIAPPRDQAAFLSARQANQRIIFLDCIVCRKSPRKNITTFWDWTDPTWSDATLSHFAGFARSLTESPCMNSLLDVRGGGDTGQEKPRARRAIGFCRANVQDRGTRSGKLAAIASRPSRERLVRFRIYRVRRGQVFLQRRASHSGSSTRRDASLLPVMFRRWKPDSFTRLRSRPSF